MYLLQYSSAGIATHETCYRSTSARVMHACSSEGSALKCIQYYGHSCVHSEMGGGGGGGVRVSTSDPLK